MVKFKDLHILSKSAAASSFAMFALFTLAYLPYVSLPAFIDEGDNILGAQMVASGKSIYIDFYSQHTPFMYHLLSSFVKFGAQSVEDFRVFFYATLAALLAMSYAQLHRFIDFKLVLVTGAVYITSHIANPEMSYTILSEQFVGVGTIYLLLNALAVEKGMELRSFNWLSIGIVSGLMVFSSFISIYIVFIALLFLVIRHWSSAGKLNFKSWTRLIATPLLVLVPATLYASYFILEGSSSEFIYQAYEFNRNVYSKYLGGFGVNPIDPYINGATNFFQIFGYVNLVPVDAIDSLRHLLNLIACLSVPAGFFLARRYFVAALFTLIIPATLTRGSTGFHSQQFWALASLCIAIGFFYLLEQVRNMETGRPGTRFWTPFVIILLGAGCSLSYAPLALNGISKIFSPGGNAHQESERVQIINTLLTKDETYFQTDIDVFSYIESKRLPATKSYGLVPWFAEVYETDIVHQIKTTNPKLIFHSPKSEVWGFKVEDYTRQIKTAISENYVLIGELPSTSTIEIYGRKDVATSFKNELQGSFPNTFCFESAASISKMDRPIGELTDAIVAEQSFAITKERFAGVRVRFATYMRKSDAIVNVTLYTHSRELLDSKTIRASDLRDNEYHTILFSKKIGDLRGDYILNLSSNAPSGEAITAWASLADQYELGTLTLNGKDSKSDLDMQILYFDDDAGNLVCGKP